MVRGDWSHRDLVPESSTRFRRELRRCLRRRIEDCDDSRIHLGMSGNAPVNRALSTCLIR